MSKLSKKSITLTICSLSGGGAEAVCVSLANYLVEREWQVDLVVFSLKNEKYLSLVSPKINVINLNVDSTVRAVPKLLRIISSTDNKIYFSFDYISAMLLVIARDYFFKKITVINRNMNTFSQVLINFPGWKMKTVKRFYQNCDLIINQCEAMKLDLIRLFPKVKSKTDYIYNPLRIAIESKSKITLEIESRTQDYILCVGRLDDQKAFHVAIEVFAKISLQFSNLRLKIIGEGELENDLKACALSLGVSDKIDFDGFQSDIIPYYENAKLTLLTSKFEGFPNVLLESIALGTPVVSYDCPSGPSEIISDDINGFLVENRNMEELEKSLIKALLKEWSLEQVVASSERFYSHSVFNQYEQILNRYF
ncbi:glycosyltransferase [Parashewanella curva]|uniref:Glycosyltransferase n=1 Tax=Parashewanella curva TaxID=2338552 RepID=A0A3L8Q1A2_9GAMM|nr:glycosyltransferase [Parashewanella curva]RLV61411.1 glycosyltransferase [Parashewanella curva]